MRLQLSTSSSSSSPSRSRSRSPLPLFRPRKPPPPSNLSTSQSDNLDDSLQFQSPTLPYSTNAHSYSVEGIGRSAQDGDRPQIPHAPSTSDKDNTSILRLVKEDYVSARCYMRELDYKVALRKALRRHMYKWYAIAIIAGTLTALLTSKHESVVEFCAPVTRTIRQWPVGWMIPIALLIVVSFPPLVGHEIIGILCGLVWGLGVGFAILAVGTFLGEIATWIAFKWFCQGRAAKFEKKNKLYASLTQLIREKSFMFALVLRFSTVPGHITTAVSASAGANFWQYLAAAFLTLPKQFVIVYLGKAFGQENKTNTIISVVTTVITLIGTVVAAVYIYYQMRLVMRRQSLCLPTIIESDATVSMSEIEDEKRGAGSSGLHSRRPWLHTNASTVSTSGMRTPTRSWSMPGHMNEEELREWVKEIEDEHMAAQAAEGSTPAIKIDDSGVFDSLPPVFSPPFTPTPKFFGTPSRLATPLSMEHDLLVPPSTDGSGSSSASVIDLTYPPTPSPAKRGESSKQVMHIDGGKIRGGREIADESDAYAIAHGARRPNYGRMRGDSRAALLGRPVDDAALEMGGGSWKRDYGRSRGDSGATLGGRPIFDDLDFGPTGPGVGVAPNGWKKDYGRSRGESGAALLGRPRDEDIGLSGGSQAGSVGGGSPRDSLSRGRSDMEVLGEDGREN